MSCNAYLSTRVVLIVVIAMGVRTIDRNEFLMNKICLFSLIIILIL